MTFQTVSELIAAIGALGTAAFGLVDATKVFWGGVNHVGFRGIARRVAALTPTDGDITNALPQRQVIENLKGNWVNGTDLASQKSIAKSLIKLHVTPNNAAQLAAATNTNPVVFRGIVEKQQSATALTPAEGDTYARFDLIVTAMLDEVYQHADQTYRNATRGFAMVISVVLAFGGKCILDANQMPVGSMTALLIGLLATPLAPIAKDLSTGLAAAVNALQTAKKK